MCFTRVTGDIRFTRRSRPSHSVHSPSLGKKFSSRLSFERIHRSNLVGMGVLPCNFVDKADYDKVKDLADGTSFDVPVVVRIDTPVEKDYYRAGGILPYVLSQLIAG